LHWKKIESLQNRRFRSALRCLLPHSKFYKKFFKQHKVDPRKIKCVEDWKKYRLPLIKKRVYLNNTRDFIVIPEGSHEEIFLEYLKYVFSLNKYEGTKLLLRGAVSMPAFAGGTESGHPIPVLITAKQKFGSMVNTADISAYLIISRHMDGVENIVGMNLFPYAPHIAWQIINMAAELRTDLNLSTAAGGFLGTEKLINIAKSAKPNVYSGMIDYLLNVFLPQAREEGVKLKGKVVFLNGATKMHEIQREKIKQMLKNLGAKEVVALDGYGASELKEATLAECEEGSGFHHVAPLSNIIRTVKVGKVDPDSDYIYDWDFTAEEEGGYAAIWNIDGAGTLLEGYLLGDHYERITTNPCPYCGLHVKRIFNINRIADLETEMKIMGVDEEKVDGALVNLTALREQLLHLHGIKEAQLVVEHANPHDRLMVKYVPSGNHDAKTRENIKKIFRKCCDVHPSSIQKIKLTDLYNEKNLKYNGILRKGNGIHKKNSKSRR
jgi:phenylacetate-coenzyme A ligase PaaK-like adenylate-forming protein